MTPPEKAPVCDCSLILALCKQAVVLFSAHLGVFLMTEQKRRGQIDITLHYAAFLKEALMVKKKILPVQDKLISKSKKKRIRSFQSIYLWLMKRFHLLQGRVSALCRALICCRELHGFCSDMFRCRSFENTSPHRTGAEPRYTNICNQTWSSDCTCWIV